jgi:hypothetical protein
VSSSEVIRQEIDSKAVMAGGAEGIGLAGRLLRKLSLLKFSELMSGALAFDRAWTIHAYPFYRRIV